ncbi:PAS domain S-box protein [Zhouia amylolytica]|uniref:PAS domain S-box protein n=1 Tax=Zhouia amylolytica TaxID=376730 RepID=UPI0020CE10EE|nr:PAS domain S-box protein [Zhouia amylolytica]MCQ0109969.1 PAS domain S-box protein [Zhouia amylolytica]
MKNVNTLFSYDKYYRYIRIVASVTTGVSLIVIWGWILKIKLLTSFLPDLPTMKFNTALCFFLVAVGLLFKTSKRLPRYQVYAGIINVTLLILAGITLLEHITGVNYGIDQLFVKDYFSIYSLPGRMSLGTALNFFFLGLGLLFIECKTRLVAQVCQYLFHIITLISVTSFLTYLFGVGIETKLEFITSMAIHTAVLFIALSGTSSLIRIDLGITSVFSKHSIGSMMARKLFLQIGGMVIVLSYLKILADRYQFIGLEFGTTLFGVLFLVLSLSLIWFVASKLNEIERQRQKINHNLSIAQTFLNSTPDPIIIVDQSAKIFLFNERAEEVFAYTEDELNGLDLDIIIDKRSLSKFHKRFKKHLVEKVKKNKKKPLEVKAVKKTGEKFESEVSFSRITLLEGTFILVSLKDITVRKSYEKELKKITKKYSAANEAAVVGVWEYDIVKNYLEWDNVMYILHGLNKEDFNHAYDAWEKVLHPEDKQRATEEVEKALMGEEEFDTSFRIIKPDGEIRHIRAKAVVYRDNEQHPIRMLGTNWDITKEKQAEQALQNSFRQNLIFVEQAPSAIAMFNRNMEYIAASQKWKEDYGLLEMDILGKSHYEIFPEIGDEWKKIHRECLEGAVNVCDEASFEREDGSVQWISWDVRPWYKAEGEIGGIVMHTANITQFKDSVRERLKIENILNKTNEIARIGTWEVDLGKEKISWSKITREIHEVPDDYRPQLEKAIDFYKEGTSKKSIQSAVTNAVRSGKSFDLELEMTTYQGNNIWVRSIGQVEMFEGRAKKLYGIFQDITEIKNYEISLKETNEKLNAILNSSYVSIIGTDKNGLITHFNKGAETFLQYSAEEMIGKESPVIIHLPEEIEKRGKALSKQLNKNIQGFDVFVELPKQGDYESQEWTYVRKDGSTFSVQLVVTPVKDDQGEIEGFLGVAADISELKNAEKEIKSLLSITTEQNDRLKNFAHIVSHNLRSHSGNFEMLLDVFVSTYPEFQKEKAIELLQLASRNLKETIQHLNEVVVINTEIDFKMENINLRNAVKATYNSISSLASEAQVEIINEVQEDALIKGLPAYVESILLNFITNGIKYRSHDRNSFVKLSSYQQNGYTILDVEDNGLGIDLNRHGDKLFGMYKTFHHNKDARGIGLFITKNQMEAIGGKIEVESKVDQGTNFKLYFKN